MDKTLTLSSYLKLAIIHSDSGAFHSFINYNFICIIMYINNNNNNEKTEKNFIFWNARDSLSSHIVNDNVYMWLDALAKSHGNDKGKWIP